MIVILTDFSADSIYTGLMKGVILTINPAAKITDLTNSIGFGNIRQAAFILKNTFRYFPKGSIFLCVVDPGVGSSRKAIALKSNDYIFVGPDNGLFSYLPGLESEFETVELNNSSFHLVNKSNTFHGRDIFAPVAAHLSLGEMFGNLGSKIDAGHLTRISQPKVIKEMNQITGEIVYSDNYGNLITSIHQDDIPLKEIALNNFEITIDDKKINSISKTFSDSESGELLAYQGSMGYLEIAVNMGSAEGLFKDISKLIVRCVWQ